MKTCSHNRSAECRDPCLMITQGEKFFGTRPFRVSAGTGVTPYMLADVHIDVQAVSIWGSARGA